MMESAHKPALKTQLSPDVGVQEVRIRESQIGKSGRDRALSRVALFAIVCAGVLLRVWHLGRYSLWYDEVFSVVAARSSWHEMFRQILIDRVHPPVFYISLKVWIAVLGDSMIRLRLFSVLFSTLTFIPVWNCLKQTRLSSTISLALLSAIACNPFLVFYAQELRMYALLAFLAACSLSFYLADDENKTELWLLGLTNVLLVLTHAAGTVVVLGELAHALIVRSRSRKYVALAPALAGFACWMLFVKVFAPHPAMVLHNVSWIPKPTFATAYKTLAHILGGTAALIVLNLPIAIVCFRRVWNRHFLLFLFLSIATIACVLAFSLLIRPVWQERYLVVCVVPYYLLAGWSLAKLPPNWKRAGTVAIALAALVSLEYDLTHRPDRPDFSSLVAIANESNLPLLSSYDMVAAPLAFGIGDHDQSQVQVIESLPDQRSGDPTFITRDVAYSVGQRDWIQGRHVVSIREFLYAWDNTADSLLPAGVKPDDLSSHGCELQQLAKTHGQGHEFTLFKAQCN